MTGEMFLAYVEQCPRDRGSVRPVTAGMLGDPTFRAMSRPDAHGARRVNAAAAIAELFLEVFHFAKLRL
jgi:hypothetical protein